MADTTADGRISDDEEIGFEEGIAWLPSYLLQEEALWDAEVVCSFFRPRTYECATYQRPRHHRRALRFPEERLQVCSQRSKSSPRTHCRAKYPPTTVKGGPGMRAVFLNSGQRTCGTGVFLPQTTGTGLRTKRPACSPVLLPMRVVEALNLNVHELGLQILPRQGTKRNQNGGDGVSVKNKNIKETAIQCSVLSKNHSSSAEIFLPKEWTY